MSHWIPLHFIDETIAVEFRQAPMLEKRPDAPAAFIWRGRTWQVTEVLATWFDFERTGRPARNMAPAHQEVARRRGSWGVGRYFFRVRVEDDRAFDLYFDRAPEKAGDRKGHWFLYRELQLSEAPA